MEDRPGVIGLLRPPLVRLPMSLSSFGAAPPLGLAYIASVLREAGHQVELLDATAEAPDTWRSFEGFLGSFEMHGLSPQELVDRLPQDTRVVGITHMFLHEWEIVKEVAELAKARFPEAPVVLGGENATAFWSWIFDLSDAVDYIVLGEGEATAVDLMAKLLADESAQGMPGVAWRTEDGAESGGLAARIRDPDSLPLPAWDLMPVESLIAMADNHAPDRGRTMPMLATRGCPYTCTFCSSPDMWTTRYEMREPAKVVDEIRVWVEQYDIENINFCDLTAVIKKSWIVEFCERLIEANLGVTWQLPTGTRSEVLDREVLEALERSGCKYVTYNPESGSNRLLGAMKKKVRLESMLDSLKEAHQVGLTTRLCFITGHPEERRRDVLDTARFIIKAALSGADDASVMVFGPYPGSEDFKRLVADEKIVFDETYFHLALIRSGRSVRAYHPSRGHSELLATQMGLLFLFYGVAYFRHPTRFVDRLRSLVTGKETTAVDQLIRVKRDQLRTTRTPIDRSSSSSAGLRAG